jgi:enamine deaminase RidA (YjgF/YER057c/UK114 family)
MTRRHIASGSTFEREVCCSRAVVVGDHVYVSGTTGFDHATMMVVGLAHPRMRIEIEVDAIRGVGG